MAIDYSSLLTEEQKRNLLNQRIQQFSAEAYQHDLNRQVAVAMNNPSDIEQADKALATLDTAITVHQEALAALPPVATE